MNMNKKTVSVYSIGVMAAIVISWAVETFAHVRMPAEVAAALGSLIGAGMGVLAGRLK